MTRLHQRYPGNVDFGLMIRVLCGLARDERVALLRAVKPYFAPSGRLPFGNHGRTRSALRLHPLRSRRLEDYDTRSRKNSPKSSRKPVGVAEAASEKSSPGLRNSVSALLYMMVSDLVKEMEFVTAFRRNSKRMVPGAAFTRFVFLLLLVPTAVCGQQSFYMRDTEEYQELCKNHYSLSIPDENLTGSPLTLKESSGCVVMIDSPEPPAQIRLYACVDLDGDGRQEAVLEHFTRGAHCCFDYRFFKPDQNALVPCGNLYLRNGNNPVFKDLDGDGKTEILTLDDSFAYFDGLCFACSPQLPLILCYRDGRFTDCTAGFSSLLSPLIEENLKGTAQDPTYERGMALEYLALHIIQGREKEGWAGIRRHYPNCFSWLKENAKTIHLRLDHRIYIREYLNP